MNNLAKITAAALAALTLSACATDDKMSRSEPAMRTASSAAESACMSAVNGNWCLVRSSWNQQVDNS